MSLLKKILLKFFNCLGTIFAIYLIFSIGLLCLFGIGLAISKYGLWKRAETASQREHSFKKDGQKIEKFIFWDFINEKVGSATGDFTDGKKINEWFSKVTFLNKNEDHLFFSAKGTLEKRDILSYHNLKRVQCVDGGGRKSGEFDFLQHKSEPRSFAIRMVEKGVPAWVEVEEIDQKSGDAMRGMCP